MNVRDLINRWVVLGAFALAGLLTLITAIAIGLTASPPSSEAGFAPADVTVIPAPTGTSGAPPTPTIDPFATATSPRRGRHRQLCANHGNGGAGFAHPGTTRSGWRVPIPGLRCGSVRHSGRPARSRRIRVVVSRRALRRDTRRLGGCRLFDVYPGT